jgi:hypothetical protein
MEDVLSFAAPLPLIGWLVEISVLRAYMETLLRERNAILKGAAESVAWKRYLPS